MDKKVLKKIVAEEVKKIRRLNNRSQSPVRGRVDCHFVCGFQNCKHEWDGDFSEIMRSPDGEYSTDSGTIECPNCYGERYV